MAGRGAWSRWRRSGERLPTGRPWCSRRSRPLTVAPLLGPVGFDPQRDVAPVMSVMATPVLVVGTSALAGDSMAAVVGVARAKPGKLRWATSGIGTTGHLVLDRVRAASGADITHVPYRGGGPQIHDALSGEFEVLSSNVGELQLQLVRERRLKALAVGAPMRLDVLPDVPTLAEAGFPDANLASTFGLFAPGQTPPSIIAALNRAFNLALKDPDLRRRLIAVGNHATGGSADDFAAFLARERDAAAAAANGQLEFALADDVSARATRAADVRPASGAFTFSTSSNDVGCSIGGRDRPKTRHAGRGRGARAHRT